MKILFFDTETTGLPTVNINDKILFEELYHYPYIVQLSYIIFDTNTKKIEHISNSIIKMNSFTIISDESIAIHKITNEMSQTYGIPIHDALKIMSEDIKIYNVEELIAHNIKFDINMLYVEIMRIQTIVNYQWKTYFIEFYNKLNNLNKYCTMLKTIEFCNIKSINKSGKEFIKYPKLSELHSKIFGTIPNNLHNSLIDVLVCMRCYYYIIHNIDLLDVLTIKNNTIEVLTLFQTTFM